MLTIRYLPQDQAVFRRWDGVIRQTEVLQSYTEQIQRDDAHLFTKMFSDVRGVEEPLPAREDMPSQIALFHRHRELFTGARLAWVVTTPLHTALLMLLVNLCEGVPDIHVFSTPEAAAAWLGVSQLPEFVPPGA